jgi:preprotein translocase subunit SecD
MYIRPVDCIIASLASSARARPGAVGVGPTGTLSPKQICNLTPAQQAQYRPPRSNPLGDTPPAFDFATSSVVLSDYVGRQDNRYVVGPAEMNASIVASATAGKDTQSGTWEVFISFTRAGSALFNKYAAGHYACFEKDPNEPPYCALEAIEVDGVVQSVPAIEAASSVPGAVVTGSATRPYSKAQAGELATEINRAAKQAR